MPLADLLNTLIDAGLRIDRVAESTANGIADVFGIRATKAGQGPKAGPGSKVG